MFIVLLNNHFFPQLIISHFIQFVKSQKRSNQFREFISGEFRIHPIETPWNWFELLWRFYKFQSNTKYSIEGRVVWVCGVCVCVYVWDLCLRALKLHWISIKCINTSMVNWYAITNFNGNINGKVENPSTPIIGSLCCYLEITKICTRYNKLTRKPDTHGKTKRIKNSSNTSGKVRVNSA